MEFAISTGKDTAVKKMLCKRVLCMAAIAAATGVFADTWWVQKEGGVDAAGRGTAEATPFRTIQYAVDAAAADDTILVKPGIYDEGEQSGLSWSCASYSGNSKVRVRVTKRLNIYATGDRDETVILGRIGTLWVDPARQGVPTYATNNVGCVLINTAASGTVLKGFTFRDGAYHQSAGSAMAAGGISCATPRSDLDFTVIDCTFDHCYGRGAGAMHGGLAIRCTFKRNWTGYAASAMYCGRAFNCLFTHNAVYDGAKTTATLLNCIAVNCAVLDNYYRYGVGRSSASAFGGQYYNTACYGHPTTVAPDSELYGTGDHCAATVALDEGSVDVTLISGETQLTNLCVCPATGDYRPVAGGLLDGTGDATHLSLDFIPAEERNVNFDGTPRDAGDPTPIGLLMPPVEVASGVLRLQKSTWSVNGRDTASYPVYIQSATWPCTVSLGRPSTAGVAAFEHVSGFHTVYRGMQAEILQPLPPKTDWNGSPYPIQYLEFAGTTQTRYVDGSYEGGDSDGSAEKPYTTIQDAIDSVTDKKWTCISVAKGVYSPDKGTNGGVDPTGHNACIYVPTGRNMVIRAVDGPAETFIEGAADPDAPSTANGCGPGAYRCAYLHSGANVCIAGFTFRDGHTVTNNASQYGATALGGAVYTTAGNAHLCDCVFTGNAGTTAVGNNGLYFRCTITNNTVYQRGLFQNATLSSCLIANNASKKMGTSYVTLYNDNWAFNCTICETNSYDCKTYNVNSRVVNCAVSTDGSLPDTTVCIGSVMHTSLANGYTVTNEPNKSLNMNARPGFVSPAFGDYRLMEGSPAIGYGLLQDPLGAISTAAMLRFIRTDIAGNPIAPDGGRPNAGCFAEVRRSQPIYVGPEGDDSADGRTEGSAFRTLQAAVDFARLFDGFDEVVALPGVYEEGARLHTGKAVDYSYVTAKIKSRVLIPAGITLRSRDGAASTTIRGSAATAGNAWGEGDDAVRCAFLESGATLKGFTLTDGHTSSNYVEYCDDTLGGAVLGRDWRTSLVEDCIVTGNHSPCGGAGSNVSFLRCRIYGNYGLHFGAVIRTGSLYDCMVYGNYGAGTCDLFTDVINCTFYDNYASDMSSRTQLLMNGGTGRVVNTVARDVWIYTHGAIGYVTFRNCIFPKHMNFGTRSESAVFENVNTNLDNAALAELFPEGRALSCTAPMVDAGCAADGTGDVDFDGTARVKNGVIDIGAVEYDWTGDYEAALGRNVAIDAYTTNSVAEVDGKVTLSDGAELDVTWSAPGRHVISAGLSGVGSLAVYLDGTLLGTLTATGVLEFVDRGGPNALSFRYAGEGQVTALTLERITGTKIMFR